MWRNACFLPIIWYIKYTHRKIRLWRFFRKTIGFKKTNKFFRVFLVNYCLWKNQMDVKKPYLIFKVCLTLEGLSKTQNWSFSRSCRLFGNPDILYYLKAYLTMEITTRQSSRKGSGFRIESSVVRVPTCTG